MHSSWRVEASTLYGRISIVHPNNFAVQCTTFDCGGAWLSRRAAQPVPREFEVPARVECVSCPVMSLVYHMLRDAGQQCGQRGAGHVLANLAVAGKDGYFRLAEYAVRDE